MRPLSGETEGHGKQNILDDYMPRSEAGIFRYEDEMLRTRSGRFIMGKI
jgi:hypothetical protein